MTGTTLNSALGIGIPNEYSDFGKIWNVSKKDKSSGGGGARKDRTWSTIEVLIIDEVSMTSGEMMDQVDDVLREIKRKPDVAFGGIRVRIMLSWPSTCYSP